MKKSIKNMLVAAAVIGASAAATSAFAGAARLQCSADGVRDFGMSVRYEVRTDGRKKFNASFESAPRLGYVVGQQLSVKVGGLEVGKMILRQGAVDVIGDLTFDTVLRNFPANFPANVTGGMGVTVDTLGCDLR